MSMIGVAATVIGGALGAGGAASAKLQVVSAVPLFARAIGAVTDIVEKEMYSFEDRLNGEQLTLRPEGTAGVVRAMIEHSYLREGGKRLYYFGQMFRHERPQKGRYRQFHQVGAEALGYAGPDVDAELIPVRRVGALLKFAVCDSLFVGLANLLELLVALVALLVATLDAIN